MYKTVTIGVATFVISIMAFQGINIATSDYPLSLKVASCLAFGIASLCILAGTLVWLKKGNGVLQ